MRPPCIIRSLSRRSRVTTPSTAFLQPPLRPYYVSIANAFLRSSLSRPCMIETRQHIHTQTPFNGEADAVEPVEFTTKTNGRVITINHPTLGEAMMDSIYAKIEEWDRDPAINSIILRPGSRAGSVFCEGLDLAGLPRGEDATDAWKEGFKQRLNKLYRLSHRLATLDTPLICITDGITRGAGAALTMHAPIRISTQNTVVKVSERFGSPFSVPGSSFFLPRLPDGTAMGKYIGMTGRALAGVEAVQAGLASHHFSSDRVEAFVDRVCGQKYSDIRFADVYAEQMADPAPSVEEWSSWSLGGELLDSINRCFGQKTVGEIMKALEKENSLWSNETLAFLSTRSPTFLEFTVEALRKGKEMDLASCLKMEATATLEMMNRPDFDFYIAIASGRASGTPLWSPNLEEVSKRNLKQSKSAIQGLFPEGKIAASIIGSGQEGAAEEFLSSNRTYSQYVHRSVTGLPTEEDVRKVVTGEAAGLGDFALTYEEVIHFFNEIWGFFLHPITLAPLSTPPSHPPKEESLPLAEKTAEERETPSEAETTEEDGRENRRKMRIPMHDRVATVKPGQPDIIDFFPSKFMQPQVDDPSEPTSRLGRGKRRETWGLRQRLSNVLDRRAAVDANGFLSWKP